MNRFLVILSIVVAVISTGCGAIDTRVTVEQITNARIAVELAEKSEAATYANNELRQAQDALAISNDAYANQSFERAFEFAKKATIYAKVAKAVSDYEKSANKLKQLKAELASLEKQTSALMKGQPSAAANDQATIGITPIATVVPSATPATIDQVKP